MFLIWDAHEKEAEKLRDKVREKKVAELFADMEKLDIQAERRNTEEQRRRAESAEQIAEEQKQIAEEQKQRAEAAIAILIESCQSMGMPFEAVAEKLMENLGLEEGEARSRVEGCWHWE